MVEHPTTSEQKLRVIEPYRSKDGVTAEVYFSKLGGTGAVVIEADTGTGEEAEVVLSRQEAHDLMLWLRCALGMNADEMKRLSDERLDLFCQFFEQKLPNEHPLYRENYAKADNDIAKLLRELQERRSAADETSRDDAKRVRIVANIAHAALHILDDYAEENAQTGEVIVEIPKWAWAELNGSIDKLGDDPHEVLHDMLNVPRPAVEPEANHADPFKRCQHDLQKPGTTIIIDGTHDAKCMCCLQEWHLPPVKAKAPLSGCEVCGDPNHDGRLHENGDGK